MISVCKELYKTIGLIPNTYEMYKLDDKILKAFNYKNKRIDSLRIWEKNGYRFCANDIFGLQSLHFTYTLYNCKNKKYSLILTYSTNIDFNQYIYKNIKYRKP